MCEKIVIELAKPMSNVGTAVPFLGEFVLDGALLPYPNAKLNKICVDFNVTFTNPDVEVQGTVICDVSGNCDRCLAKVEKQIVLPFCQIFQQDNADPDGYGYFGSKLDVTKAVQDEIVLSVPTLLLCKQDCRGLCPVCGADKNTTECDCDSQKENVFSALKNLKF